LGRFVALLRAVNVSGRNTLPMAELRAMCAEAGLDDVSTYIQSGNVVFSAARRSTSKLEDLIHETIRREAGLDVAVMVRSAADLTEIAGHPLLTSSVPATQVVVAFLPAGAEAGRERLDLSTYGPETAEVGGSEVYLHYPDGQGRSKVTNALLERLVGSPVTARNANTVRKLLAMAHGDA
jgi:uncharacterized protein (DUF1697 family)